MLVCINSLLNCTRTKYGHGEGPTLAHWTLPNPEPRRPSPLTGQPQERRKGGAPAWAGQPLGEGGVEGGGGHLHAVVVGALPIEVAAVVVDAAVIQRAEAHEAVLQGVVPLLVHVVVPDHVLLACEPLPREGLVGRKPRLAPGPPGPPYKELYLGRGSPDGPKASTLDLGGNNFEGSRTTDPSLTFFTSLHCQAQKQRR